MNDLPISAFEHAIRQTHGVASKFFTRVRILEKFEGETVWEGHVLVFDLINHPTAARCYAWEVDDRVTAVLHTGSINSPVKAVRASILAEHQEGNQETK